MPDRKSLYDDILEEVQDDEFLGETGDLPLESPPEISSLELDKLSEGNENKELQFNTEDSLEISAEEEIISAIDATEQEGQQDLEEDTLDMMMNTATMTSNSLENPDETQPAVMSSKTLSDVNQDKMDLFEKNITIPETELQEISDIVPEIEQDNEQQEKIKTDILPRTELGMEQQEIISADMTSSGEKEAQRGARWLQRSPEELIHRQQRIENFLARPHLTALQREKATKTLTTIEHMLEPERKEKEDLLPEAPETAMEQLLPVGENATEKTEPIQDIESLSERDQQKLMNIGRALSRDLTPQQRMTAEQKLTELTGRGEERIDVRPNIQPDGQIQQREQQEAIRVETIKLERGTRFMGRVVDAETFTIEVV